MRKQASAWGVATMSGRPGLSPARVEYVRAGTLELIKMPRSLFNGGVLTELGDFCLHGEDLIIVPTKLTQEIRTMIEQISVCPNRSGCPEAPGCRQLYFDGVGGSGKTTALHYAVAEARARGMIVLFVTYMRLECAEYSSADCAQDILSDLCRAHGSDLCDPLVCGSAIAKVFNEFSAQRNKMDTEKALEQVINSMNRWALRHCLDTERGPLPNMCMSPRIL